jgi:deoxycytidylate deaminase
MTAIKINRFSNYTINYNVGHFRPPKEIRSLGYLGVSKCLSSTVKPGKHCAFIIDDTTNQVMSSAINCYNINKQGTIHAEVGAIDSFKEKHPNVDTSKCTLLVIRGNFLCEPTLSKPCNNCYSYVKDHGFKRIIYSDYSNYKIIWF